MIADEQTEIATTNLRQSISGPFGLPWKHGGIATGPSHAPGALLIQPLLRVHSLGELIFIMLRGTARGGEFWFFSDYLIFLLHGSRRNHLRDLR